MSSEFLDIRLVSSNLTEGLTEDQKFAFGMYEARNNMVLVGKAGTGKSHLINVIRKHASSLGVKVYTAGTTGVSVVNIQGDATLNSMFGLKLGLKSGTGNNSYERAMSVVNGARRSPFIAKRFSKRRSLLIVDEASMGDCIQFWMALEVAKFYIGAENLQVILVGDPLQLPPVEGDYFWKDIVFERSRYNLMEDYKFQVVELREPVRQRGEDRFIECLNELREGRLHPLLSERFKEEAPANALRIYFNNDSVKDYNKFRAAQLKAQGHKSFVFKGQYVGDPKRDYWVNDLSPIEKEMELVVGQKFMVRRNGFYLIKDKDRPDFTGTRYVANGNVGEIIDFSRSANAKEKDDGYERDSVLIKLPDGVVVEISPVAMEGPKGPDGHVLGVFTQLPGHAAEAITGHKVQGLTIRGPVKIHAWQIRQYKERPIEAPSWLYVACSRVTRPEDLYFDNETGYAAGMRQLAAGVIANQEAMDWLSANNTEETLGLVKD